MDKENEQKEGPLSVVLTDDLVSIRLVCDKMTEILNKSPKKSRVRSLVITKLEEASLWASKGMLEE